MRKFKRLLAGMVTAAMVFAMVPTGIIAADETEYIPSQYTEIIETYIKAINENWTEDQYREAGLAPSMSYSPSLDIHGYALKDIDGDSSPELFIGGGTSAYLSDLYSIKFNQMGNVAQQAFKKDYKLQKNGIVQCLMTSEDGNQTIRAYYELIGTQLVLKESILDNGTGVEDGNSPWYHSTTCDTFDQSQYQPISMDEMNAIRAKYPDEELTYTPFKEYTRPAYVPVTGVEITTDSLTLDAAQDSAILLNARVLPENATNKKVRWSSSDSAVLKVYENGGVEAVSAGKATVTVTTEDGGFTDTLAVTVIDSSKPQVKPTVYNQIIDTYVEAITNNWTAAQFIEAGLNESLAFDYPEYAFDGVDRMEAVGFVSQDINNDGTAELFVTAQNSRSRAVSGKTILDLYTVIDGQAQRVLKSPASDVYNFYLNADNTIVQEWETQFTDGKTYQLYTYFDLAKGTPDLNIIESVAFNAETGTWYYTTNSTDILNIENYTEVSADKAQAVMDGHGGYADLTVTALADYTGDAIPVSPQEPVDPDQPVDPADPTNPPAGDKTDNPQPEGGNAKTGIQNHNSTITIAAVLAVLALIAAGVYSRKKHTN